MWSHMDSYSISSTRLTTCNMDNTSIFRCVETVFYTFLKEQRVCQNSIGVII